MLNKLKKGLCIALAGCMVIGSLNNAGAAQAKKKATLKTKKLTMYVGQKGKIKIKNKAKKNSYTFKSSKKSVAKVNKAGRVTAVKKGSAKITVSEKYKIKKKTKTRKLGVCRVTVYNRKKPDITPAPTPTLSPTNPAVNPTDVPATELPKETSVPAYYTMSFDFENGTGDFTGAEGTDGKEGKGALVKGYTELPLGKYMQYGGLIYVRGYIKQDSGSAKNISVGYDETYLSFTQDGDYIDKNSFADKSKNESKEVSCASGEWTEFEVEFEITKYTKDFNLTISAQDNVDFVMDNLEIESEPCLQADYPDMVANSTRSTGNNARIKAAMEKAKKGEDVTIAYIGGSITEGFAASETNNAECYAETSYELFKAKYAPGDGSNVRFINAGMSGTGSNLGLIRYERDVIAQNDGKPADILFIDYAVNDGNENAEYYENLIRYALEQGSAVVLMFVMYMRGSGNENGYSKIGEFYDLAMVSPASGMKSCDKASFDKWFYWSDGHPDVGGHRYMADCIMNMFDLVDAEDVEEDNITDVVNMNLYTKNGKKNYVGMKTLEANTEEGGSVISIDRGSFTASDKKDQPKLQYIKNGQADLPWFPNELSCAANSYLQPYKATIKCNSILIAYRANTGGKVDVYLDGKKVKTLSNTNSNWSHANIDVILNSDSVSEHELEIRVADDAKNKLFTIYAIGYSNQEEFRSAKKVRSY